jgi:hypothetical protein
MFFNCYSNKRFKHLLIIDNSTILLFMEFEEILEFYFLTAYAPIKKTNPLK